MIRAIFFDLDGTLLPMNEDAFTKYYFKLLCMKMAGYGFDPNTLPQAIWGGVKAMYKNDGSRSNEDAFFEFFGNIYGSDVAKYKPIFNEFYLNEFKETIKATEKNPYAREIIDYVNNNFEYNVLSTNPIFPYNGTLTRMGFIGLTMDDFDLVTTYENCCFTKPNPKYFAEILKKFDLKPEEVVLFGNNTQEDYMCASSLGIKTIMVGDYIIHNEGEPSGIECIKLEEVLDKLKSLKECD